MDFTNRKVKTDEPVGMAFEEALIYFRNKKVDDAEKSLETRPLSASEEEEMRVSDEKFRSFMIFFYTLISDINNVSILSSRLEEYFEDPSKKLNVDDLKSMKSVMTGILNEIKYSKPEERKFFPEFIGNLEKEGQVDTFKNQVKLFNEYIMQKLQTI